MASNLDIASRTPIAVLYPEQYTLWPREDFQESAERLRLALNLMRLGNTSLAD